MPEIKPIENFLYEAGERRDPFHLALEKPRKKHTDPEIGPDPLRRKEELEQFPLDSLSMVGTIEREATQWGLVTAPNGTLYRVRVGNYAGQNDGKITRIASSHIELTELVADGLGVFKKRQASIALAE